MRLRLFGTKSVISTIAFSVIFLIILGCSKDETPFRVGFNTWVGYGPFYIAQEKGYFNEVGLKVELERIEGTGERRAAIIAGRLDAMGSTVDDLLVGSDQGVKARCILLVDESAGADGIVANKEINTVNSLKGKRVAVQPGFVNHFFLLYILDKHSIDPKEISIVPMEPDKAGIAFINGEVDAAVTWEPYLTKARERQNAHVLVDTNSEKHIIVDIFAVSEKALNERQDDVKKFIAAYFKALDFYLKHPDEGTVIISQKMGLNISETNDMLSGVHFITKEENKTMFKKGELIQVIKKADQLWLKAGFTKKSQKVENLIDAAFIQ